MSSDVFHLSNLVPDFAALFTGSLSSSDTLSATLVLILLGLAIGLSLFALVKYFQARKKILYYHQLLEGLTAENFAAKRREVSRRAMENPRQGGLWLAFDATLLYSGDESRVLKTVNAEEVFHPASLSMGLTENRFLAAGSGYLTGLGVLGTFAGLMLGLAGLDVDPHQGGSDSLTAGIFSMINGASVAFSTSLWGTLAALVFSFLEKVLDRGIRKRVGQLQARIDDMLIPVVGEQTLVSMDHHLGKMTVTLQGLAEQIGTKMQETLAESNQAFLMTVAESLEKVMAPAVEALVDNARHGSEDLIKNLLEQFMEKMGKTGAEQGEQLASAAAEFRTVLERFGGKMEEMTTRMQHVQEGSMMQEEARRQSFEDQSLGLANRVSEVVAHAESLMRLSSEAGEGMVQNIAGLKEVTAGLSTLVGRLESSTIHLGESLGQAAETTYQVATQNAEISKHVEAFLSEQQRVGRSFVEAATTLDQSVAAVQNHIGALTSGLERQIERLEQRLQDVLTAYGDQVQTQVQDRMKVWNEETVSVLTHLTETIRAVSALVDDIETKSRSVYVSA
jgi:hypothetical protein